MVRRTGSDSEDNLYTVRHNLLNHMASDVRRVLYAQHIKCE